MKNERLFEFTSAYYDVGGLNRNELSEPLMDEDAERLFERVLFECSLKPLFESVLQEAGGLTNNAVNSYDKRERKNMKSKLFEDILEQSELETIASFSVIDSAEKCKKALAFIVSQLETLSGVITSESVNKTLDKFLPGSRLRESDVPQNVFERVQTFSSTVTKINESINRYLTNPAYERQRIEGIDSLIRHVIDYTRIVNTAVEENSDTLNKESSLYSCIKTFNTILGVFNHLVIFVDRHNSSATGTDIHHDSIEVPKLPDL